jgi:hypothetical protein
MAPAAGQGSALETTAAAALAVDKSNSARSETGRQKKEKKIYNLLSRDFPN